MHEELRALLPGLAAPGVREIAGRRFHLGTMEGHEVVLVLSGIGKVAAATTAALLFTEFNASAIVLTGVAGGIGNGVRVGDVIVARELVQHDMDASPLFPRYEVPLTGRARFGADDGLSTALAASAARCMAQAAQVLGAVHMADFDITAPRVHQGLIASGDRFVATKGESRALAHALPDALAVEMEGAALAQVCHDFKRPYAVLRTVSDRADDDAHADFARFIVEVASVYTNVIVRDWLLHRDRNPAAAAA
jgi:adenosylhomocysteine nucleosidase